MKNDQISLKPFLWQLILVFFTLALGIFTAKRATEVLRIEEIVIPQVSFFEFLGYFFFFTLIFLFFVFFKMKEERKKKIFRFVFVFSLFVGGEAFWNFLLNNNLIATIINILLIYLWYKKPTVFFHNLLMMFALVGAGVALGLSLNPKMVIFLLIIFSFYDIFSVYISKHMIRMAEEMIRHQAILGFILPLEASGLKEETPKIFLGEKKEFNVLGGGDVAFPLLFSVSLLPFSLLRALIVSLFSLIGLFFNFLVFLKRGKRPLPALPLIALFSIIGYLLSFKITNL
jgi:presenilin-like A22 family membrane protease